MPWSSNPNYLTNKLITIKRNHLGTSCLFIKHIITDIDSKYVLLWIHFNMFLVNVANFIWLEVCILQVKIPPLNSVWSVLQTHLFKIHIILQYPHPPTERDFFPVSRPLTIMSLLVASFLKPDGWKSFMPPSLPSSPTLNASGHLIHYVYVLSLQAFFFLFWHSQGSNNKFQFTAELGM